MAPLANEILLVDDEPAVRFTLAMLLRRRGYTVTEVTSGSEALDQIQQRPFDLLLLDLIMPSMTGLEVAQQARLIQPNTRILILTGSGALDRIDLGAHAYLPKTASPQEVLARVAELLADRG